MSPKNEAVRASRNVHENGPSGGTSNTPAPRMGELPRSPSGTGDALKIEFISKKK